MKTCIAILALLFAASVSAETTVEIGSNWQTFAPPDLETKTSDNATLIVSRRFDILPVDFADVEAIGVAISGEQATEYAGFSLNLKGDPFSVQLGAVGITRETAHLSNHLQILTGIKAEYGRVVIRYMHISNGKRYLGRASLPNVGEDVISIGLSF